MIFFHTKCLTRTARNEPKNTKLFIVGAQRTAPLPWLFVTVSVFRVKHFLWSRPYAEHLQYRQEGGGGVILVAAANDLAGDAQVKTGKLAAGVLQRHHQIAGFGSAGGELQLRGGEDLQDVDAAGFEARDHALVQVRSLRQGHVTEEIDDHIPGMGLDDVVVEVGGDGGDAHTVLSGETVRFGEPHRGLVDGGDVKAQAGEVHRVAPLALAEGEDPAPRCEKRYTLLQKAVGFGAEAIFIRSVTVIPHRG